MCFAEHLLKELDHGAYIMPACHAYRQLCAVRMQGGKEPNSNDCKLGPQLKHVIIGSKTIKVRDVEPARL